MPKIILVISGKRKSGKDFIASKLIEIVGEARCGIIRLSGPLKHEYAVQNGLDYKELLNSSAYKEIYRKEMIAWGESKRKIDPGYFCNLATSAFLNKDIWIVTDARRISDINYFQNKYANVKVLLIRVIASDVERISRGWKFVTGVDDAESECGLDNGVEWDIVITNSTNNPIDEIANTDISHIIKAINSVS